MAISENVRFCCENGITSHPQGEPIANLVKNRLLQRGWRATGHENWRDCGWSFVITKTDAELQLVLAQTAITSNWLLQISPKSVPGFIGWLLRKKRSASPIDVYRCAMDVHEIIRKDEHFTNVRWAWDTIPKNEHDGTDEPTEPPGL